MDEIKNKEAFAKNFIRNYVDYELEELFCFMHRRLYHNIGWSCLNLVVIQVGADYASDSYIRGKKKDCERIGINLVHVRISGDLEKWKITSAVISAINLWSTRPDCVGIVVQLPIPKGCDIQAIRNAIPDRLDVDGFKATSPFDPCTPKGIIDFLDYCGYSLEGKNAMVVGRSDIVGKPLARMLLDKNATVTVAHSKTYENSLKRIIGHSDIVFLAIDKVQYFDDPNPFSFCSDMPYVIDITLGRGEDGKLHGSLTDSAINHIIRNGGSVISGTGGVGLLTRLALMQNACKVIESMDKEK